MKLEQAIRDFVTAHEVDNDSPNTISNYRSLLPRFAAWLGSVGVTDIDELRLSHLREWLVYLQKTPTKRGKPLSDSTIHQYAVYTHAFCHWLEEEEVIEKPITTRFKLPKVEKKFIPTFTFEDVERLFQACERRDKRNPLLSRALTARDRAIVAVLLDAGIRRKELVALRLCDVDTELYLLNVHRKGNKWQQVPISREGFKPLYEYVTRYRKYLARLGGATVVKKQDALFLSDTGEPLTIRGVSTLFQVLERRAGIEGKRVSAHQCRRYMATRQLELGRSPVDVQRQLGHTTLTMTNQYASLTTEHLRRSHERFSPLRARVEDERGGFSSEHWGN